MAPKGREEDLAQRDEGEDRQNLSKQEVLDYPPHLSLSLSGFLWLCLRPRGEPLRSTAAALSLTNC